MHNHELGREMLMKVLVIDVGGTHIKILATGQKERREFESGSTMTPAEMVAGVLRLADGWDYDVVSMGYPGPVLRGKPVSEPHNLGPGWVGFDYESGFKHPVKIINDAAMQALGSYRGGRMLFLGLGTGLGSAMIVDGVLEPMELAHLGYKKGRTYEDYLGLRGLERLGKKRWRKEVCKVTELLKASLGADYVVLGGGNVKKLKECPKGAIIGSNDNAFIGGLLIWGQDMKAHPVVNIGTAAGPGTGKSPKPVPPAAAVKAASKSAPKPSK